jgi:predicted nucleotidyltransferase component of viral defense system
MADYEIITNDWIRKTVIAALFSDDVLKKRFVLKGGNALDIGHGLGKRASFDVDLALERDFEEEEIPYIQDRVVKTLDAAFREKAYTVFDPSELKRVPENISDDVKNFWGGYILDFKIISLENKQRFGDNLDKMRRGAAIVALREKKVFKIEISIHEYCGDLAYVEIEGYRIAVYSVELVIAEKMRALCQQLDDYLKIVHRGSRGGTPRAKDFYDIYEAAEKFTVDMTGGRFFRILRKTFEAKRVPLKLLASVRGTREFHRPAFAAVEETVKAPGDLKGFDFYFDYVVNKIRELETSGII